MLDRRTVLRALPWVALGAGQGAAAPGGDGIPARNGNQVRDIDDRGQSQSPFEQSAKLVPPLDGGFFGYSVDLHRDTALVGAWGTNEPNGDRSGAAYVFEREDGTWTQQATLVPGDGDVQDRFGMQVAVGGDIALVGAEWDEDPNGEKGGSVYVFEREAGDWPEQAKLTPADGDDWDKFGSALATDGETALIGALLDEDPNGAGAGSVYVYERDGGAWTQRTKLAADEPAEDTWDDRFGHAVALDGDTAVVGTLSDDEPNGPKSGAAYVFHRDGGDWTQQATLAADDGDAEDRFGFSVDVDGGTALIGARGDEDPNGPEAGSAYVFERDGGTWAQQAKLVPGEGDADDRFGYAAGLDGDTAVVGAPWDEDPNGTEAGAAYVFTRGDGGWSQTGALVPDDGDADDRFGWALALDGGTALVGAYRDEDPAGGFGGSAYVFDRPGPPVALEATTAPLDGVVPGGVEAVTIRVTNTGSEPVEDLSVGLDRTSLPTGWTIDAAFGRQDRWDAETASWAAISLGPGVSSSRSLTVAVPDTATVGETHDLRAVARNPEGEVATRVPVSLVDRFDPTVHGFGFTNWGAEDTIWPGHDYTEIPRTEVERFVEQVLVPTLDDAGVGLPPFVSWALTAVLYPLLAAGAATNGHCYGMIFAARTYFEDPDALPVPAVDTAGEVTTPGANDDAIGGDIDFYQTTQGLDVGPVMAILILTFGIEIDHAAVLDELRSALADGETVGVGLASADRESRHQVLAYGLAERDELVDIYAYNPSSPAVVRDGDPVLDAGFDPWGTRLADQDGDTYVGTDRALVFDTSGDSVSFPAEGSYRVVYETALPLHGGGDLDQPIAAFGTLVVGSLGAALEDALSGLITVTVEYGSTGEVAAVGSVGPPVMAAGRQSSPGAGAASQGGPTRASQGEDSGPTVSVAVTGPDGEALAQLDAEAGIDMSGLGYDQFWYASGAEPGSYSIRIDAADDVEYSVAVRGELAGGGSIDQSVADQASPGATQTVTATVPAEAGQTGTLQVDEATSDEGVAVDFDPRIGIGGALAALGGGLYVLKRRLTDRDS